jgi:hypothetical protein
MVKITWKVWAWMILFFTIIMFFMENKELYGVGICFAFWLMVIYYIKEKKKLKTSNSKP